MTTRIHAFILSLLLGLSPAVQAESTPPPAIDQTRALIAELLSNVDWQLLLQLQKNLLDNMELLVPYTQEYLQCLEQEQVLEPGQQFDLRMLLERAGQASQTCNVIIQSLIGQMEFDISREEFEQGLSPEYRELLHKSL